jgi:glycosyltransferase involved in cell wall biosynthesis
MRLGVFQPRFAAVGGAELLAAMQVAYFQAHAIEVKLVTFTLDAPRWRDLLDGVPVTTVPRRRWTDLLGAWTRVAKLTRRARRAARCFTDCDAVLAYNYPCSTMLGVADVAARKIWQCNEPPRMLHLREANPMMTARVESTNGKGVEDMCASFHRRLQEAERRARRRAFDRRCIARLDEIYAISEFSRDNARRIYGRCREQVIPPMVRFPETVAHRSGLDRERLNILLHSRLERPKNIDTVLRGFAIFQKRVCSSAVLHVVGDGSYRPRLEHLARELCPASAVRFHGYLSDAQVQPVYTACDVFALLPVDEPFGMVFPEAAAHGLLLVGPDHGGPVEILDGGRFGWVCDAFSPEALAQAFAEIWALDDATVDRRRAQTDRACRARYTVDVVGPQLLRLLREL